MFVLAVLSDTFRVEPGSFRNEQKALRAAIDKRYADRVLPGTGLCIGLHSIESIGDAMIYPGEGAAHYKVVFKLIIFRPFRGEVITGKVRDCTVDGIYVSLGFFEDVIIPASELQNPSYFQQDLWVWKYSEFDEAGDLWVDKGAVFRFRVTEVRFNQPARQKKFKKKPNPQAQAQQAQGQGQAQAQGQGQAQAPAPNDEPEEEEEREFPRMTVYGKANEAGLGVADWWTD